MELVDGAKQLIKVGIGGGTVMVIVDGAKQLIEVDIGGATVMVIAELAVVSEKAYRLE